MSNLKLKHTPQSLEEALEVLDGRQSMKIGHNTELATALGGTMVFALYHGNRIVEYSRDGVRASWAGWATNTTTNRLNMLAPGRFNIFRREPQVNGSTVSASDWHKVS